MSRTYQVISADSHLETSENFWPRYLPQKYLERAPRLVALEDGGEGWLVEGQPLYHNSRIIFGGRKPIRTSGVSYFNDDGSPAPGTGGPAQRLREQDEDGIDAEVLFPSVQGTRLIWGISDPRVYLALVQGYNDFLAKEFCSLAPDRLLGVGVIPISGIDDAVRELERCKELGLKAVTFHTFPNGGGTPKPEDDRFWKTALDLQMPLAPHITFGDARPPPPTAAMRGKENFTVHLGGLSGGEPDCIYCISQLLVDRVFDRFPDLRFMFAETNAGWMPFTFYMLDDKYDIYRGAFNEEFKKRPTEYINEHLYFSFVRDPMAMKLREFLPVDNLMWSSDFPHGVTSFPESRKWIDIVFEGVPGPVKRKVLVDNAVNFFGLDSAKAITPTPD
jgi:predicted TIM-barrel fold metal-dependent hydrolase